MDFWGPSKKLLNDLGFLTQLKGASIHNVINNSFFNQRFISF